MDWINVTFWLAGTVVVVLGPIILVHELGHFIAAKLAGVRVEEFGLGFPPRLLRLWRGKGYMEIGNIRVDIPAGFQLPQRLRVGARVDAAVQRLDDGTYVLRRLRPPDQIGEHLELDSDVTHQRLPLRGEVTALEPGTLYSLNLLPMGAFVKMTGEEDPSDPRSLAAQPKRWRLAVMLAGPLLNILVALMLLTGAYVTGVPDRWLVEVTRLEPGTAAEEAGLQPGDIILAAGGEDIEEGQIHLQRIIRATPEHAIELTILRGGETLNLTVTPQRTPEGYGFLGIWMAPWPDRNSLQPLPVLQALNAGINDVTTAIMITVQLPARLIQGDVTPQEARPASMVGISSMLAFSLQQSIEWGLAFPVLQTASFTSLALGLTNLLPLPALDGGRILFVLIEAIRRRRISPEREAIVHFIGLVILISLMALAMLNDIVNPIIPWSRLK